MNFERIFEGLMNFQEQEQGFFLSSLNPSTRLVHNILFIATWNSILDVLIRQYFRIILRCFILFTAENNEKFVVSSGRLQVSGPPLYPLNQWWREKVPDRGLRSYRQKPFSGGGGGAPPKNVLNFRYFRWYLLTVFCIILRILCARIQLSSTVCLTPLQNILLTKHSPPPPSGATLALTTAIGSESYSHMTYKELCNSVRQNHHNSRLLCHKPTTLEYISHQRTQILMSKIHTSNFFHPKNLRSHSFHHISEDREYKLPWFCIESKMAVRWKLKQI